MLFYCYTSPPPVWNRCFTARCHWFPDVWKPFEAWPRIDSVDDAVEQGWTPYFFDREREHEVACPTCSDALLQTGEDGEMEIKEEYRGKLKYLDEAENEDWQDHS